MHQRVYWKTRGRRAEQMQVALCEGKGEADLCNSMLVGSGGECTIAHTGIVAGAAAYPRTALHRSALCVPVGGRRSKSFFLPAGPPLNASTTQGYYSLHFSFLRAGASAVGQSFFPTLRRKHSALLLSAAASCWRIKVHPSSEIWSNR